MLYPTLPRVAAGVDVAVPRGSIDAPPIARIYRQCRDLCTAEGVLASIRVLPKLAVISRDIDA